MNAKNNNLKWIIRVLYTALLYGASTVGLSAGLGSALSWGINQVEFITLSQDWAFGLGLTFGIAIQLIETDWVCFREYSGLTANFIQALIFVDGVMIFVALQGHFNLVWIYSNYNDVLGMFVHLPTLLAQLAAAVLGSLGAELALKKTLELS